MVLISALLQLAAAYLAIKLGAEEGSRGWSAIGIGFAALGLGSVALSTRAGYAPSLALAVSLLAALAIAYASRRLLRYRGIVESLDCGVMALDRKGRVTYANRKAGEVLGGRLRERCMSACGGFLNGTHREPNVFEVELSDASEERRSMLIGVSPLNEGERLAGCVASIHDITQVKAKGEEMERLRKSGEIKDLFIDILHHDLLNYANIIKGFAELGTKENPESELFPVIRKSTDRMIEVIRNATKLSKLRSIDGMEMEDIDLGEVVAGVLEELEPAFANAGMTVENRITGRLPVRGSRILKEVFWNFLSNASKYARDGGRVVVYAEEDGGFWKVCVADFGPGIPEEHKEAVFERFSRGGKHGVKGSGLGLAIAKRVAELHGGEIGVEDNTPKGSIFWVKIPRVVGNGEDNGG